MEYFPINPIRDEKIHNIYKKEKKKKKKEKEKAKKKHVCECLQETTSPAERMQQPPVYY